MNYLFQADERIKHIQNLYGGYNLENTLLNNWQNHILTIVMSLKQICYPDLDYILQINSEYGLFFCLPQIINSGI